VTVDVVAIAADVVVVLGPPIAPSVCVVFITGSTPIVSLGFKGLGFGFRV
jgi:hypothetical protein